MTRALGQTTGRQGRKLSYWSLTDAHIDAGPFTKYSGFDFTLGAEGRVVRVTRFVVVSN